MGNSAHKAAKSSSDNEKFETPLSSPALKRCKKTSDDEEDGDGSHCKDDSSLPAFLRLGAHKSSSRTDLVTQSVPNSAHNTPQSHRNIRAPELTPGEVVSRPTVDAVPCRNIRAVSSGEDLRVCMGCRVDAGISSNGRVHSASCSAVNPVTRTVTVEWFEKGDTKGKEVDFDAIFSLNPDLAPQMQAEFKHPGPPPKHVSHIPRQTLFQLSPWPLVREPHSHYGHTDILQLPHRVPHTTDADEDDDEDQTSTSDGELSDYVAPPPSHSQLLGRGPATRASGRILRNSQSTSNAAQLLRPYGALHNMSPLPSQLPRVPPTVPSGLNAAMVARSQSASRLTMVRSYK
ncbi:hypothetical protein HAZT_HAZT007558 [Hyalella azteca]|uniref:Kinesin-like protein KIF2A-like N-terminal domain-containing protein n=1 Tax=Hyalella azteca TaxID=294128 RepID=A0A6A0HD92_HYAAZ|nr:hypothetical protein HAZT_HAZT007558 [Hyalella azteca]